MNEGQTTSQASILIVAAGRGMRAGAGLPKQYRKLGGKTVLRRTIESFQKIDPTFRILCVIHHDDLELYQEATRGLSLLPPVYGGETRQESVRNGLIALADQKTDYVLIHDAARPFVSKALVAGVIEALQTGIEAVVPALPLVDTIKHVEGNTISHTVPRDQLFAVQTPQGFFYDRISQAHERAQGNELTDDGAIIEADGGKVCTSAGDPSNYKLTTEADFKKAERDLLVENGDIRVGTGYDVHKFEEGNHVWLCGLKIPFSRSLKGHSDADVALHALTDALLAAIADGDIGTHFPPNDQKWRGCSSDVFLKFARDRIANKGGIIAHLTICIICEKPKIGPYNEAMRKRIADLLEISVERVSVQATTTEKLGFTGREEGIAAQASATVRLPFGES